MNTPSREDRMVVIERDADGTPTVWCDPEIADLVAALNKAGVRTVASCSGHGHRPGNIALKDGRWLVIAEGRETLRRIEALFPVDINGKPCQGAACKKCGGSKQEFLWNGDGPFQCRYCAALPETPAAEQCAPQGDDDGAVPLDLEQHEREALNYLGTSLKDRNAKRAVDKALALCDFYAGRNQLTFCHRDLLQRKLLPAAAPAVAKMWLELVEQIAAPLNCRASEHVDANAHVIAAARRLAATQPEARGVAWMVPKLPGNWPEDASHENGDYECSCSQCGATFYGHKRRVVCKVCAAAPEPVRVDGEWLADVRRCLEDVSTEMRSRGRGDERFQRLIQRMPAALAATPVGKCTHPGCNFTDGKPCAYAHCPNAKAVQA